MIVDVLLLMLIFTLQTVRNFFPDGSPLGFVTGGGDALAAWVGVHAGPLDKWVPIHEAAFVAGIEATVVWPAIFAYHVANWIWRHIPVWGGG